MKSKIIKTIGVVVIIGIGVVAYLWFMPHRNIQAVSSFKTIDATTLVNEFLKDKDTANSMYLDSEEGESKVLTITGNVASISKDQLGQKVVLLKNTSEKMGVACTFTLESNQQLSKVQIGDFVKIKGVIRSGSEYDVDLDLAENVIIEKGALITE